jgi:hypothetical protein
VNCQIDGCNRHPVYAVSKVDDRRLVCRSCMQFLLTVGWKLLVR